MDMQMTDEFKEQLRWLVVEALCKIKNAPTQGGGRFLVVEGGTIHVDRIAWYEEDDDESTSVWFGKSHRVVLDIAVNKFTALLKEMGVEITEVDKEGKIKK